MIYNYVTTIFRLIAGIVTKEFIGIFILCFMFALGLWMFISLVKAKELRQAFNEKKLCRYIDSKKIVLPDDAEFYALLNKLPAQFVRAFKSIEFDGGDLPSRYLNQTDCVETPLFGGLFNQNRNLMRTITNFVVFIIGLLSIAVTFANNTTLTGLSIAESLVLPAVALLIYRAMFYSYILIRQYYYRSAVIRFNELIDALNDNYERGELVFKSIEEDEDLEEKRGRGRPKKIEEEKDILVIENDEDFERALARAEKLVIRLTKKLSDSQKRRTNNELSAIMSSLAEYEKRRK